MIADARQILTELPLLQKRLMREAAVIAAYEEFKRMYT